MLYPFKKTKLLTWEFLINTLWKIQGCLLPDAGLRRLQLSTIKRNVFLILCKKPYDESNMGILK